MDSSSVSVPTSSSAIEESRLLELPITTCTTKSGTYFFQNRVKYPTSNIRVLKQRQENIIKFRNYLYNNPSIQSEIQENLNKIVEAETILEEDDKGGSATTTTTSASESISTIAKEQIFFSSELTKPLNHIPYMITILIFLKVYVTPLIALLTPIIMMISPYFILRFIMNINMPWDEYITMSTYMILGIQSGEKFTLKHFGQVSWVLISMIQTMIQPFITAFHTYRLNKTIIQRATAIKTLHKAATEFRGYLQSAGVISPSYPELTHLPANKHECVSWYDDTKLVHYQLINIIGHTDFLFTISSGTHWRPVIFSDNSECSKLIDFYDMSISEDKAVKNSVNLGSHMLLTGPNRGGKSSILRGILQQVILAQTTGFTTATEFILCPYTWIHTRLQTVDIPGQQSLFEHEVQEAASILRKLKKNPRGLVCIDELFHSTNPTDAEFSATIFLQQLWKASQATSLISTHTFSIVKSAPDNIQRLCAYAEELEDHKIRYTYSLRKGECYVSSVRDVLKENGLCG